MMELNDKYVITIDHIITNFDKSIVSWLYQPIMGYKAMALYNILLEEQTMYSKTKLGLQVRRLLRITGLTDTGLKNAKEKLEGLGLLKTYYRKKTNTYNFKIKPPISPDHFFEDEILSNLLASKLGEQDYEYSVLRFAKANDISEEDEDVSSSFVDAYADEFVVDPEMRKPHFKVVSKDNDKAGLDIILDFAKIDHILIDKKVAPNVYLPFKEEIAKLANFYKITTREIARLILESITKKTDAQSFDLNRFSELVHSGYDKRILQNYRTGEQMEMHIDANNEATNLTMLEAKVKEMSTIEPAEYLSLLKDSKPLSTIELDLLSDLVIKYNLTFGVINCLVEFVYFKNSNHRIEPKYVYKIAATLSTMQLTSVEATMEHLRKAFQNNNQKMVIRDVARMQKNDAKKGLKRNLVKAYDDQGWSKENDEDVVLSDAEINEIMSNL